jgi:hypothetical protein
MAVFLVLLVVGAGSGYCFVIMPAAKYIEQNKDRFSTTAKLLIDCLENYRADQCSIYLSDAANKAIPAEKLTMLANAIKSKLGKRADGALVDNTIQWQKFAGPGGPSLSVSFQVKAVYEKDAVVTETYRLVQKGNSAFLVEFFHIGSDKFFQ